MRSDGFVTNRAHEEIHNQNSSSMFGYSVRLFALVLSRWKNRVWCVRPEDYLECKDANDILRYYGPEAIREAIANAIPIENPRIKQLSSVKRKDWNDVPHFDSGIPSFDKLTGGLYLGQLVIITGQRGLGKSTFASQIGAFAIKAGYTTFFYSGELNDWQFQGWFERQLAGPDYINGRRAKNGFVRYAVNAENEHDIVSWLAVPGMVRTTTRRARLHQRQAGKKRICEICGQCRE